MKGLIKIPQPSELFQAYTQLQNSRAVVKMKQIMTWSQWVRFDPRLGELLIQFISSHWQKLNPLEINQGLNDVMWPAVWGVLLDQAELLLKRQGIINKKEFLLYKAWAKVVMSGVQPASGGEQFFIGLLQPGGKTMVNLATKSSEDYRRWGFIGNETMINKFSAQPRTVIHRKTRSRILEDLIKNTGTITVSDYMEALDNKVTRRQAQRDLCCHPMLHSSGFTRGRVYKTKKDA